ncbi:hypothetical protein F2Q68_00025899 [Brassica cretica]|uniref:Uncharacterized protein n=1 Tax=Brassica cretica TaxID=69181 RepID=A0A8S9IBV1_BRACR|nr:hypothetical protein F2Q68_00025899 [Brassica cretica]
MSRPNYSRRPIEIRHIRSDFSLRGHVLPSSTSRGHVSRGHHVTTASRHRRRSKLRIARPNRNSIALSLFTANIFGALIPERIDRRGEISSTTVHRKHPEESIACIITLSAGEVHSPPTRTQATEPRLKRRNKNKRDKLNPKRLGVESRRGKAV